MDAVFTIASDVSSLMHCLESVYYQSIVVLSNLNSTLSLSIWKTIIKQ